MNAISTVTAKPLTAAERVDELFAQLVAGENVREVLEDAVREAPGFFVVTQRGFRRRGIDYAEKVVRNAYAFVVPGKSVRLFGIHDREPYDRTFVVGDTVAYDSWNMTYTGAIKSIDAKGSVPVIKDEGLKATARLDIETFNWRNRELDLERIAERNLDVMQHC